MALTRTQDCYVRAKALYETIHEEVIRRTKALPEPAEDAPESEWEAYAGRVMEIERELRYDEARRALHLAEEALIDQMEALARRHRRPDAAKAAQDVRRSPFLHLRNRLIDLAMRAPLLG